MNCESDALELSPEVACRLVAWTPRVSEATVVYLAISKSSKRYFPVRRPGGDLGIILI